MTKQNVQWASEQVIRWMDEDPSISWGEVWEALADCLDVDRVPVLDRIKIKEIVCAAIN